MDLRSQNQYDTLPIIEIGERKKKKNIISLGTFPSQISHACGLKTSISCQLMLIDQFLMPG